MLELRLTADAKRIATMGEAIRRECRGAHTAPEHAESLVFVAEQLAGADGDTDRPRRGERRPDVLVIVTVQSDATLLMVREARPGTAELGDRRRFLLDTYALRWSTVSGRDGRTVWAEISRAVCPDGGRLRFAS